MDTLDLTPAQAEAAEVDAQEWTPSEDDWQWYMEQTYVDPAERL